MKRQNLFSGKNKKDIVNLSSAELALRVVKVKWYCQNMTAKMISGTYYYRLDLWGLILVLIDPDIVIFQYFLAIKRKIYLPTSKQIDRRF